MSTSSVDLGPDGFDGQSNPVPRKAPVQMVWDYAKKRAMGRKLPETDSEEVAGEVIAEICAESGVSFFDAFMIVNAVKDSPSFRMLRTFVDRVVKRRQRSKEPKPDQAAVVAANLKSREQTPPEELERQERRDKIDAALQAVSELDYTILSMKFDGLSFEEIGEKLGVCKGTICNHYHRALNDIASRVDNQPQ